MHTFIEKEKESNRTSASEEILRVKFENIAMEGCLREVEIGYLGWLMAEDVQRHGATQRMGDQMHSAMLLKPGVVFAPQSIHTVGFFGDGLNHLRLVVR